MSKKKLAIVLVNYQDYANKFLSTCRDSIYQQSYGRENIVVYIVDNASTEISFAYLQANYPEAIILRRNDGNYTAANNLGFQTAIEAGIDYLLTLNMDTKLEPDCLEQMVLALETQDQAGIIQAKVLLAKASEDEKVKINTLGNKIHFLGFGTTSYYQTADFDLAGYPEIKGYASGCCFLTKAELFQEIGAWNENYYMYHDDLEFSVKAKMLGYRIYLAPQARVYHYYEFSRSQKMLYYMERNRYLFLFSFYPLYLLILLIPGLLILNLAMLVYSLVGSWFQTWLKVNAYFLKPKTWRRIRSDRSFIRQRPRAFREKIAPNLVGKLEFLEIDNFVLKYIANPVLNLYWEVLKFFI